MGASESSLGPSHVAIIMDGNGRWASARGKSRSLGHRQGARAAAQIIEAAIKNKVKVLTLFTFSTENSNRPPAEVRFLFKLFARTLATEVEFLKKNQIKFLMIGDKSALSDALVQSLASVEALTAHHTQLTLVIALNYGGQWDISAATRRIAALVKDHQLEVDAITPATLKQHMTTSTLPPIDLCVRTGGESRISNFLLWDLAYAELYFTPIFWPDFTPQEFDIALSSFLKRQRRFGLTPQQRTSHYA